MLNITPYLMQNVISSITWSYAELDYKYYMHCLWESQRSHFHAEFVGLSYESLEFFDSFPPTIFITSCCKPRHWWKEINSGVAPEVRPAIHTIILINQNNVALLTFIKSPDRRVLKSISHETNWEKAFWKQRTIWTCVLTINRSLELWQTQNS